MGPLITVPKLLRWTKPAVRVTAALTLALAAGPATTAEPGRSLKARLATRSLLLAGAAAKGRLVAVGERGHILLSDDSGRSWRQADVPTTATLTAVRFHGEKLGWAVGHDEVILRTRDGGEHWERVRYAPEKEQPLLDVWFQDENRGFAVGAYGLFLESANGGATWTERKVTGDDRHLNRIVPSGPERLYLVGEAGKTLRSDDRGATWKELPSPYQGSFYGGLHLGGESLMIFGLRGHLYRTEDGGRSWKEIRTGTDGLLSDAALLPDGRIVVVGTSGAVLVSSDKGLSFALQQIPDRHGLSGVLAAPAGTLVALGERGAETLPLAAAAKP
ncbi:MAG: hypothetical protein HY900_23030 [Deltaproteobacteria bacterium]|nr:hypothetical protein [Deltaproteobacteria bacterium]